MQRTTFISEKKILSEDQATFAALSGDVNPVHVDPVFARRTQFGQQIVHGMHLVLWALDRYFAVSGAVIPTSLRARFPKPTFVGDTIRMTLTDGNDGEKKLEVTAGGVAVAMISLNFRALPSRQNVLGAIPPPMPSASPRDLKIEDMDGLQGTQPLGEQMPQAARAFPAATHALGTERVSALLATSRVVGMECPGLHSIFAGLVLDIANQNGPKVDLLWRVVRVDPRLRKIDLEVSGGGIAGRLETFARLPPISQLPISELRRFVDPHEFEGQTALIVGGSRGLGETTAKIIAAGGGEPIITYAVGRDDAVRIATEINSDGRHCQTMRYDATLAADSQLSRLPTIPASFYYFATSGIFRRKTALYEPELMREFLSIYVDGFYALCCELRARRVGKLVGFWPSTVALDQPLRNLIEYCLAKQAGEILCSELQRFMPSLLLVVQRLPRILTDQTATLLETASKSALDAMLPIIREVQSAAHAPAT